MNDRDTKAQRRGRELVASAARHFPQQFKNDVPESYWPLIGTALLSRMTTTLATVLDLQSTRLEADAATLTRSLYEHAVHFAWLAADPSPERIERWRKDDFRNRLKADDDMRTRGVTVLTAENRGKLEQQDASMVGAPLNIAELAVAADKHWAGKLRGMGAHTELESFSGLYAVLYRPYSAMAHPSEMGLQRVVEEVEPGRSRVQLEQPSTRSGPWGIACVVFTIALFAAAASLGWPDPEEVAAIYDRNA